ncbi:MAG: sigma 54-interacting transcriptional regulator [Luminiphilus sp.]|nr:sigma 54-interacting transcriptional regulator [Luminiphilus sp.]
MPQELVTRPALRTEDSNQGRFRTTLRLTIAFHPDLQRIGQWVNLCPWEAEYSETIPGELSVGRYFPEFSDRRNLEDNHVSRLACVLKPRRSQHPGGQLSLRIEAAAHADVRIGAAGQKGFIADHDALVRGVSLRMSYGVVLLLRVIACDNDDHTGSHKLLKSVLPGASVEMMRLWHQIALVAPTNLPILIQGESGVGKERVAQAVHELSTRSSRRLVVINLAAIPQDLAAAELFGSIRGAYTGAIDRLGAFQRAHKGTLFLDEIADAPIAVQVQLLRALEQGEVQILGGASQTVNVRIVAATDQSTSVQDGFRAALHHRVAGFTLDIPPLRERPEDIVPQALMMLDKDVDVSESLNPRHAIEIPEVAAHWARFFFDALSHGWPGNSRELRHAVMLVAQDKSAMLPLTSEPKGRQIIGSPEELSDQHLEQVYRAQHYEIAATAAILGLSRQALYRRLEVHPSFVLVDDLADGDILAVMQRVKSIKAAALELKISHHALRPRLRRLGVT